MKKYLLFALLPAMLYSQTKWRHTIECLGDADHAELVKPGAGNSDAAMALHYLQGSNHWGRYNWPLFEPVAGNTAIQFQFKRIGRYPKHFQVRVLTADGIEWGCDKPSPTVTEQWQTFNMTPSDFHFYRGGDPNNLPGFTFDQVVQFQILPMETTLNPGCLVVDDLQFLPNGPNFTHDQDEWITAKSRLEVEYARLRDIHQRLMLELKRLDENYRQVTAWTDVLKRLKQQWPAQAAQDALAAPGRPWLTPNTARLARNNFNSITIPHFPSLEYFTQANAKLQQAKPVVINDFTTAVPFQNHILYKAIPQDKPVKMTEGDATFIRQHIVFTDEQDDQTVFLEIPIPKSACDNGEYLDLTNQRVAVRIRCTAKGFNVKLPFILRICSAIPDNRESFIDILPNVMPNGEWQELLFNVSKPLRDSRPSPATAYRFDVRVQNIAGKADDFTLDVQPFYKVNMDALEQQTADYLMQRKKFLLDARMKLLSARLELTALEDSLRETPELRTAYLKSFIQPLATTIPGTAKLNLSQLPLLPIQPEVFHFRPHIDGNHLTLHPDCAASVNGDRFSAYLLSSQGTACYAQDSITKLPGTPAKLHLVADVPLWMPFTPNMVRLVLIVHRGDEIVAYDNRSIGLRSAEIHQSGPNPLLRQTFNHNRPDWHYNYNGQPYFLRTSAFSNMDGSLRDNPVKTVRLLQDLWMEGGRYYGMDKSKPNWKNRESLGIGCLSGFGPSYKSLKSWADIPTLLYGYRFSRLYLSSFASMAGAFVNQVGNEVELDSWGASINDAFPGTAFQPLDIIAQQLIDYNLDSAPTMYVRAGSFNKVEPLPHEDISGINQYTGRYSGQLDEVPRDLAELAAEATLFNRPLMITEWNGPKYSWASSAVGGITLRGAAYYLEKYWRAMCMTPGIVGSAEFTLNWVIAPFEDLTNQSREEAFKNRPRHAKFGGGHTADHVPLLNAAECVPDDCYRSMQGFHSPLYVMLNTPGDITVFADGNNDVKDMCLVLSSLGKKTARDNQAAFSSGHHQILLLQPGTKTSLPGIQPLPDNASEPSFQTVVNPNSPDHLVLVVLSPDADAYARAAKRLFQSAVALHELAQKESLMPRLLGLTDPVNAYVFRFYPLDKAMRGYAFSGDNVRTELLPEEFLDDNGNLRVAWRNLRGVFLDAKRELKPQEIKLIQEFNQFGVNLVVSKTCHEKNPALQALLPAKFTPDGDFSQKLTLTQTLHSHIPIKELGSARLDVVKKFSPKHDGHNGTKVFSIDAPGTDALALDAAGCPVIVTQQQIQKHLTLLGYDLGDTVQVHWNTTHKGVTHPTYDRDTACGLERPTLVALNAALAVVYINSTPPPIKRLKLEYLPQSMLVDEKHPVPTLRVRITDSQGGIPQNIQLNACTRLRVDGRSKPQSPYYRVRQSAPGIYDITFVPQSKTAPDHTRDFNALPYVENNQPYQTSKILSVQFKAFAIDGKGNNYIPEDTAFAFILK